MYIIIIIYMCGFTWSVFVSSTKYHSFVKFYASFNDERIILETIVNVLCDIKSSSIKEKKMMQNNLS